MNLKLIDGRLHLVYGLIETGLALEPLEFGDVVIFHPLFQGCDATVVCGLFSVTLLAPVQIGTTIRLVLIKEKPVQHFAAALIRTLDQTEFALFIHVLHQLVQRQVGLPTLLWTVERGRLVRLLDEWVQIFDLGRWLVTLCTAAIVLFKTRLTYGVLAPLTLDWKQGHHMAIGTCQHRKDHICSRV